MVNWFSPWNLLSRTQIRLNEPVFSEWEDESAHLLTAQEAWTHAVSSFKWHNIALKEIESVGVVNTDGTAFGWRFCADLLDQQATTVVVWEALRARNGCVVGSRLHSTAAPYPVIGSPIHQIVAHGMGSEKLLNAAWKQMRERTQDIPSSFVDSDQVALDAFEAGWVGAYQLQTVEHNQELVWELHHGEHKMFVPLSNSTNPLMVE